MNGRRVRRPDREQIGGGYEPIVRQVSGPTKQRSRRSLTKLITLSILVLAGVVIFWLAGKVSTVDVQGSTNPDTIRLQVESIINHPFWHSHLYWVNTDELTANLASTNAQTLAKVSVSKSWLKRSLIVNVDERRPVTVWQTQGRNYLTDQTGVIMNEGSAGNLPLIVDMSNIDAKVGSAVAPAQFVTFVLEANDKINPQIGLTASRYRIVDTTNELYVDTSGGFYIRFDTTRPVDDQLGEVKTILSNDIHPSQYIDVRLAYKAYYK